MGLARQLLILLIASVASGAPQQDGPRFGRGPWIYLQGGDGGAVPGLVVWGDSVGGIAKVHLDDGRVGTISVQHAACQPPERCGPIDCGCFGVDRYRVMVSDPFGVVVARTDLWAAYGNFHIVPFDLVDGPGDELLIVRVLGRSSPPNGHDLKILQVTGGGMRELLPSHQIAGNFSGMPMVCGQWRGRVAVDSEAPKPRALLISHDVIVPQGCVLDEPDRAESVRSQRPRLTYADGRYSVK